MIVALARKLLIALWRMVRTGEVPQGAPPEQERRSTRGSHACAGSFIAGFALTI